MVGPEKFTINHKPDDKQSESFFVRHLPNLSDYAYAYADDNRKEELMYA